MGRKIEAVIFDWAGTLVDFGCMAPLEALRKSFSERGIEVTDQELRRHMGLPLKEHVREILRIPEVRQRRKEECAESAEEEKALTERTEELLLESVRQYSVPKPYVRECLETLRKAGIKIGSTTAYTEDIMDLVTEEAKSRGVWVDEWFCPECSGEKGRPYPYMIFKNMQFLGISGVDRVIKVGNTPADIQEGKRAGVLTVGILEGSLAMGMTADDFEDLSGEAYEKECARTRQIFCEAGADYVIANLKELPELIRRLEAGDEEKISA